MKLSKINKLESTWGGFYSENLDQMKTRRMTFRPRCETQTKHQGREFNFEFFLFSAPHVRRGERKSFE